MNTKSLLMALSTVAALAAGCNSREPERTRDASAVVAEARETALVRFVNATALGKPVDVFVDDTKVIPDVGQNRATDYSEWKAERHQIAVKPSGSDQITAANSESLGAGERYTVVGYSQKDGSSKVAVFHDNLSAPEAGKARLRLIHVADGAKELDVYPAGSKSSLVRGVDYSSDSAVEITPGTQSLEIRNQGESVVAVKLPEINLEAGKTYTIIVAADQNRRLHAIQLESAEPAKQGYLIR